MITFRLYFDKDKETQWLNEMSAKGYAINGFFSGFYRFVPCEKGEYLYQIDHTEGMFRVADDYRRMMDELGIRIVCLWGPWVILQKKAADGAFELYSDVESLCAHYMRIRTMFRLVAIFEFFCFIMEAFAIAEGILWAFPFMLLFGAISLGCVQMVFRTNETINRLREQNGQSPKDYPLRSSSPVSLVLLAGLELNLAVILQRNTIAPTALYDDLMCFLQGVALALILVGAYRTGKRRRS